MKNGAGEGMATGRVLVIDDEAVVCLICEQVLGREGFEVVCRQDANAGLEEALKGGYDMILLDLVMPELNGLELLHRLRGAGVSAEVVVITGYATVETAVEAMKRGAADYVAKPFTPDDLRVVMRKVMERSALIRENLDLRRKLASTQGFGDIVGESKEMEKVFSMIQRVAPTEGTVLITGESGTGKDMVARAIHRLSARCEAAFLACDCSALAPTLLESELFGHVKGAFSGAHTDKQGLFEAADRGTLFLDEVGNINLETQGKLLRSLESRRIRRVGDVAESGVDIRLIAATNRNLNDLVVQGRFREDLFYRLNVVPIHVPPLRERRGDIPRLAMFFLGRFHGGRADTTVKGFTPDAMQLMESYGWPGNVRELKNIVERLAILGEAERIEPHHLPKEIRSASGLDAAVDLPVDWEAFKELKQRVRDSAVQDLERRFLRCALDRAAGNVSQAARTAGLPRTHFHALMRKHGLKPNPG